MNFDQAIIVRSKTRLEQLIERFNTKAQTKFYIERSGMDLSIYEKEHDAFYKALDELTKLVSVFRKHKVLDRSFLPNYIFTKDDLIFVLGQDGLVANTAKYVKGQPIVAVNPDNKTYDGILLPFTMDSVNAIIQKIIRNDFKTTAVTMAKAEFSDGQSLLAFNDFFIGPRTHTSARYALSFHNQKEMQSSSGLIVSTGAGSTGWMSSVLNMVNGISSYYHHEEQCTQKMNWNSNSLFFAVREPFLSKTSSIKLCFGEITQQDNLIIESQMPENGIVFSDGIEADAVQFNSGTKVTISIAKEKANLVSK
ncbi:MAG: sugar kinase [Bacteroidetes bacterium]|jgi:NAD kinase|nr:sugar kinase [Bacteroidota bacterium]